MSDIFKVLKIIPKDEKKNYLIFFIMASSIMILESLSIGLIFPIVMIGFSENVENNNLYIFLSQYLENYRYENIILILLVSLIIIYFFKNLFLIYLYWWKNGFSNRVQYKIEKKLLDIYLNEPFVKVLNKNSAIKIRNIVQIVSNFSKLLISSMVLIIESVVLVGITSIIFFINPLSAIVAFTFISIIILSFYYLAKLKAVKWSKERISLSGVVMKTLIEGLSAIKEIKIFNKENFFINRFLSYNMKYLHLSRKFSTFHESPKVVIETAGIIAVSSTIIIMFNFGESKEEILAMVGIFGAAGLRLLPATTRIVGCINEVKNNLPSLDLLIDELKFQNPFKESNSSNQINKINSEISLEDISFTYPTKKTKILSGISFKIKKGTITGIIGESGKGKSTLLNLIMGFLTPTYGKIRVDGVFISEKNLFSKNFFSYVSQEIFLLNDTLQSNIVFGDESINQEKLKLAVKIAELNGFISELDHGLETIIGEKGLDISGGQRQRIAIARALYKNSQVLILDEATSELDEENEMNVISNLKNLVNKTIILSTHNKSILKYCDQVLEIK